MNIIGSGQATVKQAQEWATKKGATKTFIGLAPLYWNLAPTRGKVRPEVAYAQSAHETGFGKFGGVINESFHNPCGLKTPVGGNNQDPNAHTRFPSWQVGVTAHLDHLALYAGASGYPRGGSPDPRHFPYLLGRAKTVEALGGQWAPPPTYGNRVLVLVNEIKGAVNKLEPTMKITARKDWGARISRGTTPLNPNVQEGAALHYMGASNTYEKSDHSQCASAVRSIQNFHMDGQKWNDIAYNFLVCRHGGIFEGRAWGTRSAAQGSTFGNDAFHAFAFLGNDDAGFTDLTSEAAAAYIYLINQLQIKYPGADSVQPHSDFNATSCPGNEIRAWIKKKEWAKGQPNKNGFWKWFNWKEGRGSFKNHKEDPAMRPNVPKTIPKKWWDQRKNVLESLETIRQPEDAKEEAADCGFKED